MVDPPEVYQALIKQIKLMADVKVVRRWPQGATSAPKPLPVSISPGPTCAKWNGNSKVRLVAIASSTGGPAALANILGKLPAEFPVPILIAQHIAVGFGQGLATWLDQLTPLEVRIAQHGAEPRAGQVLLAPDNYHLTVNRLGLIALSTAPSRYGIRPSADHLFHSVAEAYGATAVGIILTGMGRDGAVGLQTLRNTGAHTIAQNEASCVVFGMPAVAIELGAAEHIRPIDDIARTLLTLL